MLTRTLIAALLALLTNTAHAESMAVSVNTSPLWSGAELTTRLTDTVNASLAYHQHPYPYPLEVNSHPSATAQQTSQTNAEVSYDHQGQHQLWSVLADWYAVPESQFRFRFGLSHDDNVENIVAYEAGMGGYNIGNNHYSAAQVGKLQGVIRSNGFVPYLGLGWGNPVLKNKHWGFMVDVGAIYPGQANVTLTANSAVLPADLEVEKAKLLDSRRRVTVLLTAGVSYQW